MWCVCISVRCVCFCVCVCAPDKPVEKNMQLEEQRLVDNLLQKKKNEQFVCGGHYNVFVCAFVSLSCTRL